MISKNHIELIFFVLMKTKKKTLNKEKIEKKEITQLPKNNKKGKMERLRCYSQNSFIIPFLKT